MARSTWSNGACISAVEVTKHCELTVLDDVRLGLLCGARVGELVRSSVERMWNVIVAPLAP